jgi:copper chaperone CopZ
MTSLPQTTDEASPPPPASVRRIDLPIAGMTCAACSTRVERVLNRLPGVRANVSLAASNARVFVEGPATTAAVIEAAIERAGYRVPDREVVVALHGVTTTADATRVEEALSSVPGVTARVTLAKEQARITFPPARASLDALVERLHADRLRRRRDHGSVARRSARDPRPRVPDRVARVLDRRGAQRAVPRADDRDDVRHASRLPATRRAVAARDTGPVLGRDAASTSARGTRCAAAARTWMSWS